MSENCRFEKYDHATKTFTPIEYEALQMYDVIRSFFPDGTPNHDGSVMLVVDFKDMALRPDVDPTALTRVAQVCQFEPGSYANELVVKLVACPPDLKEKLKLYLTADSQFKEALGV